MEELREALRNQSIGTGDLNVLLESAVAGDEEELKEMIDGVVSRHDVLLIPSLFTFIKNAISSSPTCNQDCRLIFLYF